MGTHPDPKSPGDPPPDSFGAGEWGDCNDCGDYDWLQTCAACTKMICPGCAYNDDFGETICEDCIPEVE